MSFIIGGWGPGSYYYPVLVQLLVVYSVLWAIVRRFGVYDVVIILGLNFDFELIKSILAMPVSLYRLLIFRYIFLIGSGAYLYMYNDTGNKVIEMMMLCVGVMFIIYTKYLGGMIFPINYWIGTSFVAAFFIIPIFKWLISVKWQFSTQAQLITNLGKASYHIFLFQMVYYYFLQIQCIN